MRRFTFVLLVLSAWLAAPVLAQDEEPVYVEEEDAEVGGDTYDQAELLQEIKDVFGEATADFADAIERLFDDLGEPSAYIIGEEGSGAFVVGLRYGAGTLNYKGGEEMDVYWQGPSIGLDFGGNASQVVVLVYNLRRTADLFQRFPAMEGSLYVLAGASVNLQRAGEITLAPVRTGVGLRAGASVGYMHYSRERSWLPL